MLESCAAAMSQLNESQVANIHQQSGHLSVKRTLYFVRIVDLIVSKKLVKLVVRACESCQLINPALVCRKKRDLSIQKNWSQLAMDVTHPNGGHFLTLIDCGPSCFAIWQLLQWQDSTSIIRQLEMVFYE